MKAPGLRTKFLAASLGMVALLGLASVIFIRASLSQKLEVELQKRGVSIGMHLAEDVVTPLLTENTIELQMIALTHKRSDKDIEYIFIERDGRVVAHTFGLLFPTDLMKATAAGQALAGIRTLNTEKGKIFDISAPVLKGQLAVVHVGMSGEPVRRSVAGIIRSILWITAAVLVAGSVLAVIFTLNMTKPLARLAKAVKMVGSGGQGQRVPVTTGDEIGRLAQAFNQMMDDLQTTTVSRVRLEDLVRERTAELSEANQMLSAFVRLSPLAVIGTGSDGNVLIWNGAAERLFGWREKEVLGMKNPSVPADREEEYRLLRAEVQEGRPYVSRELQRLKKDGTLIFVSASSAAISDANGDPVILFGIFEDITGRKQAEAALKSAVIKANEEKAKTESIIAAIGDAINIQDTEYRILYQNETSISRFGYHVGEYCYKTFRNREAVCERCHLSMAFTDGKVHTLEQKMIRDQETFYNEITGSPLRNAEGKIVAGIELIRDITERRQLLDQLEAMTGNLAVRVQEEVEKNRAREQLMQVQSRHAAMGEMIDNIAHQWRQPLNNLGLIMQGINKRFIDGSLTPEKMQEQAKIGMSLIAYMSQTINDFTHFLRHDKALANFRIKDVVAAALTVAETSLKRNAVTMIVDIDDDITVTGLRNEYTQVIVNILNNARDIFVERGIQKPVITIRACREDHASVLTIADNGGGITSEVMDKIFSPNFTTKGPYRGTGIGLYMSKIIIEKNMKGRLSVRNTAEGAEFRIEVRHDG